MRTLIVATAVACGVSMAMASGQPARSGPMKTVPDSATEAAVRAAEDARFKAQTTNDFDALARLLADDVTYTHSSAAVDTKATYIESMRSGRVKYESIEPRDVTVRMYGTTAVITGAGRFRVTANGAKLDNQLRYTDIWVLREGRWQMVAWQSTKLP